MLFVNITKTIEARELQLLTLNKKNSYKKQTTKLMTKQKNKVFRCSTAM